MKNAMQIDKQFFIAGSIAGRLSGSKNLTEEYWNELTLLELKSFRA